MSATSLSLRIPVTLETEAHIPDVMNRIRSIVQNVHISRIPGLPAGREILPTGFPAKHLLGVLEVRESEGIIGDRTGKSSLTPSGFKVEKDTSGSQLVVLWI